MVGAQGLKDALEDGTLVFHTLARRIRILVGFEHKNSAFRSLKTVKESNSEFSFNAKLLSRRFHGKMAAD